MSRLAQIGIDFPKALRMGGGAHAGLLRQCESLMEQAFAAGYLVNDAIKVEPAGNCWMLSRGEIALKLRPQWDVFVQEDPWTNEFGQEFGQNVIARADFAYLLDEKPLLLVDIDGHDFHERTKDQAKHDKARDRRLLRCGYRVARFSGPEVNAEPRACAVEAFSLAAQLGGLK